MKNIIENVKNKKSIHYFIIFILGLLIAIPYFWLQIYETDDGYVHILRVLSAEYSTGYGSFPFLITPFFCRNFGYAMSAFYGPIVTYVPYIFALITKSTSIGIRIFSGLTIPISGIFMYNYIYEVTKNKGMSFLSAILYMVFPYRLEIYFNRFSMGEISAFMFIPIVFQGLYNLIHNEGNKHYYITIGAVGLILSHTITTTYTAVFCVIYILFHLKDFFKKDVIIKCLINVFFILLISAFFIIPIFEFQSQASYAIFNTAKMRTDGYWVMKNTINPSQFLKDIGEKNGVSFVVGIPTLIMLAIMPFAYKHLEEKNKDFYIVNFIMGIIALYMCTKFFPWIYMPHVLTNIQYAWRLELFGIFFLIPVMAMNVCYLIRVVKNERLKTAIYLAVILIIAGFTINELSIYQTPSIIGDRPYIRDEEYEGKIRKNPVISHFALNRDYLPDKASNLQKTYMQTREDKVYVLRGNAEIDDEEKNALKLNFTIKNADKDTILELPYIFYPGYRVNISYNGKIIQLATSESDNGFVQIVIPDNIGEGKIQCEYTGTKLEKASYIISLLGIIAFIAYIIYSKKKHIKPEKRDEI